MKIIVLFFFLISANAQPRPCKVGGTVTSSLGPVKKATVTLTEFRKLFESRAVSVSIEPNGQASVQLKVISTTDVEAEESKVP